MSKDYQFLNDLTLKELKEITKDLGINSSNMKKSDIISFLKNGFKKYGIKSNLEETKKNISKNVSKEIKKENDKEPEKYEIKDRIGHNGKEGTIFCVKKKEGRKEFAMKKFKNNKSSTNILKEGELLKEAGKKGLAPKVYDIDTENKFIVMDKLDKSLFDILKENEGKMSLEYQKRFIEICKELDKLGISHGDPSPLNFMEKDGKLYIIDFGFGKKMEKGEDLNIKFMPIGFILKIKDVCGYKGFPEILKYISKEDKIKFNLK
jgi:tRNA A-37 threonylcarbamoyl transferase component Bud32